MNIFEFSRKNEIRLGKGRDFTSSRPIYYVSLQYGMECYFHTIEKFKDTYHFLLDFDYRREDLAFNFFDDRNTINTILSLHRFFELFIKHLLSRFNEYLSVKLEQKPDILIKFLTMEVSPYEIQSVEYGEAYKRLLSLIKLFENEGDKKYDTLIKPYDYMADKSNKEGLDLLTRWRNQIIHNGKTIPNIIALDYLVTQKLIPLADEIINTDNDTYVDRPFQLPYYSIGSDLNIMEEFKKIKFDYKDFEKEDKSNLSKAFQKIGHLKELGKYNSKIEPGLTFSGVSFQKPFVDGLLQKYYNIADGEKKTRDYQKIVKCPCCGHRTLVVYKQNHKLYLEDEGFIINWCECTLCRYFIKDNIGDPYNLGLAEEKIFD